MNIFVLHLDPTIAAQYHCDKHVSKMIVETAQLLSAAHDVSVAPYKHTHVNHPCSIWTRKSLDNYKWLCKLGISLINEYNIRYSEGIKSHATATTIDWLAQNQPNIPNIGLTEFAQAMPEQYKSKDAVEAYRRYYLNDKKRFAKWVKGTPPPNWWIEGENNAFI